MVSGSSVVVASGNDTTSAQFSINVWSRQRYGVTTSATPTQDDIKAMTGTKLVNARTLSVSGVTADGTQYYSYAYPKILEHLLRSFRMVLPLFLKTLIELKSM